VTGLNQTTTSALKTAAAIPTLANQATMFNTSNTKTGIAAP